MGHNTDSEYRRYSAVLREDGKSYAITPTRRPRGKALVEISGEKGILKCSVKNLRPLRHGGTPINYSVWLLGDTVNRKIPVRAGSIVPNKEGVGEQSWEFDPDDVLGTGLDIDGFPVVEVRVLSSHKATSEPILTGQLELEEATLTEEPKMERVSPFGGALPQSQWWKFYPGYSDDLTYYPSVRKTKSSYRQTSGKHELLRHRGNAGNISEAASEECFQFTNITGPVFQGHQLVGLQYDHKGAVKYLVHGIPGRFCLRDQPYGGASGYIYWHPLPGQRYRAGDYGYWLIYIDPVTGEVVFPKKPTRPPDCEECNRS